jgi:BirA family biotin operon repressor/biotin-[acetyl-CoA-carboxylase] ligase
MDFPLSSGFSNRLIHLAEVDSTNLELERINSIDLPVFTVLVADSQTAGKGRMGRSWSSEPGASLAVSLLLRPKTEIAGWVTLLAGVSVARALGELGVDARVKWPNDVLVQGKKICGILAQLNQDGSLILGVGLNLKAQQGAPDTATSLEELGVVATSDEVLALFLAAFRSRFEVLTQAQDFAVTKTLNELEELCSTLGQEVRAEFPDGKELIGRATAIDRSGHLVIATPEPVVVSAADVWHLRN